MLGLTQTFIVIALLGPAPSESPAPKPVDPTQPAPVGEVAGDADATAGQAPATDKPATAVSGGVRGPDLSDPFQKKGESGPNLKDPDERHGKTNAEAEPPSRGPAHEARVRKQARTYPNRPIKYRLDLSFDAGTTFVADKAYFGFDDNRNLPGFRFGFRGDAPLGKGLVFLGGGAAYQRFSTGGEVHQGVLNTDVTIHEPMALVRVSFVPIEGIDPFVELAGGPTIIDSVLSTQLQGSQKTITGFGQGFAGVTAYLPKKWLVRKGSSRATAGIELGLGYVFRPGLELAPKADVDEDETIDTTAANFGDVFIRGFVWRLGLFVRFM